MSKEKIIPSILPRLQGLFSNFLVANLHTVAQLKEDFEASSSEVRLMAWAKLGAGIAEHLEGKLVTQLKLTDEFMDQLQSWLGVQIALTANSSAMLMTLAVWAIGVEETRAILEAAQAEAQADAT